MDYLGDMDSIKELLQQRILQESETLLLLSTKVKIETRLEVNSMNSWVNTIQKSVKNNKRNILTASLAGLVGGPITAIAAVTASNAISKNSKQDLGILDERREDLLQQLERFTGSCVQKNDFIGLA